MHILKAIECGIGLANTDPACELCARVRLACPAHAAENVLRILVEFGYVEPPEPLVEATK